MQTDRASKQLYQDPAYTLDQIIETLRLLKSETESIFAKVKPPAPEKPAEDAKMESEEPKPEENAEMKSEEQPAGES